MLYLLDANTLITAKNSYYQMNRVPEFWDWLVHQGEIGNIKIPLEIYEEFKDTKRKDGGKGELAQWAGAQDVTEALLLDEEAEHGLVSRITYDGYVADPTDDELVTIGRDPFLLSYALKDRENRCIVTSEVSKRTLQGAKRRIPDVCDDFGIKHIHSYQLVNVLDFSTSWNS